MPDNAVHADFDLANAERVAIAGRGARRMIAVSLCFNGRDLFISTSGIVKVKVSAACSAGHKSGEVMPSSARVFAGSPSF